MGFSLSWQDVMYAAVMAGLLTWFVVGASKAFKLLFQPIEIDGQSENTKELLEKCYHLFPKDSLAFQGITFKRGMTIRIVTSRQQVIEGELLGLNNDNMVCLLTERNVVAQDLGNIEKMVLLKEESDRE